jgi:hypothetical protein
MWTTAIAMRAAGMALLRACVNIRGPAAPVAQLDRAPGYEPGGREFESLRARHTSYDFPWHFGSSEASQTSDNKR